jgi:ribosome-associated protein
MKTNKLIDLLSKLILQKKGFEVLILDLKKQTSVTDYFIICSASSDTQVKAIADHVIKESKKIGQKPWHNEGYKNLSWVLLDFVDVVVHIFLEDVRKFYNLEGLWGDAEITEVKDNFEIQKVL